MKIEVKKTNQKLLSGRTLAKQVVSETLNGVAYDEYELDFDQIEMVNQSFMNELVRCVFETNPKAHVFVSNCATEKIRERFEQELKFIKSVFKKTGTVSAVN